MLTFAKTSMFLPYIYYCINGTSSCCTLTIWFNISSLDIIFSWLWVHRKWVQPLLSPLLKLYYPDWVEKDGRGCSFCPCILILCNAYIAIWFFKTLNSKLTTRVWIICKHNWHIYIYIHTHTKSSLPISFSKCSPFCIINLLWINYR